MRRGGAGRLDCCCSLTPVAAAAVRTVNRRRPRQDGRESGASTSLRATLRSATPPRGGFYRVIHSARGSTATLLPTTSKDHFMICTNIR